jgi:hypothetical protein
LLAEAARTALFEATSCHRTPKALPFAPRFVTNKIKAPRSALRVSGAQSNSRA